MSTSFKQMVQFDPKSQTVPKGVAKPPVTRGTSLPTSFKQMAQLVPKRLTAPLASGSNPAHQLGKVVALLIVLGNFATGGGGGRYLSDHGIGHILTVLDSFSSSVIVSSVSPLPTQHRMLIAVPIYCKRASSDSMRASMLRQHSQRMGDPIRI